ncbi:hypothetical protein WMY93_013398 [Mugilogobius chulae]|uniref:Adhesion G-protein coupled receptor G1 n=1 Tax=Mugilogobius chulae TaxID=88201 RepID=A0AAW0P902_9GOBI
MEPRLRQTLWTVFIVATVTSSVSGEDDTNLKFCGTWIHGKGPLSLNVNLTKGCDRIVVSANQNTLSVNGQLTTHCSSLVTIPLKLTKPTDENTAFCVYWEPLQDQLKLKIDSEVFSLCSPVRLKDQCCTHLSHGSNTFEAAFGISAAQIRDDWISNKTWALMSLMEVQSIALCIIKLDVKKMQGSRQEVMFGFRVCKNTPVCLALTGAVSSFNFMFKSRPEKVGAKLLSEENTPNPCIESTVVMLDDSSEGYNVTLPPPQGVEPKVMPTIHLPPALKKATKSNKEVVCTYFRNNSLFKEPQANTKILIEVVSITIDNEIIRDLSEPIKIAFHHGVISKTHSRKCVSWDTRKDPMKVNWLMEGCETKVKGEKETECHCNHLTYFTVLVQLEPKPVRHLLALTAITSLGCAVSFISCIALIVFLCRKSRRSKELSIPIHLGLAVSLALLNLLFFFTGVLANVCEGLCFYVGAALHYALLSSLIWMGIEVFHTFWMVQMVFSPTPKPWIWHLIGFAAPAVPVIILAIVPNIYGLREIHETEDSDPYKMCWMKNNDNALLAHYVTNLTLLAILVTSGLVMLFLVYREIRNRDEWRQNRVAFFSIWGLSCLFGTTWGLTFLDFGPLADFVLFVSCILNSFQGFLLMLRFYMLNWMRKQAGGSVLGSSSTGSTRQHMLQTQEKS